MYSDNDYRYYLEHRLAMSDNFLAHYGVKGMKWKEHRFRNALENSRDSAHDKIASIEKKAKTVGKKAGKKVKKTMASAEKKANITGRKIKKTAKKAYKYADDHVDTYAKKGSSNGTRYAGAGIRVKTKKATTDVGVYGRTDSFTSKKGKSIPYGADVGIEVYRDNKKKRKRSYTSGGIGTTLGVPVYKYRHGSKKY